MRISVGFIDYTGEATDSCSGVRRRLEDLASGNDNKLVPHSPELFLVMKGANSRICTRDWCPKTFPVALWLKRKRAKKPPPRLRTAQESTTISESIRRRHKTSRDLKPALENPI
jgi:hypothetical protein